MNIKVHEKNFQNFLKKNKMEEKKVLIIIFVKHYKKSFKNVE